MTNARGQLQRRFYDAQGRLTGYVSADDMVSYTYDENGNVLTVTDKNGIITRSYDALNRVTSYTDTYGNVIRYAYDAVGNLTELTYPDGTAVTYTYDACNRLTTVTDWAGRTTSYTYDKNGNVVGVTKPDGSCTTTVYDECQRVISSIERSRCGSILVGYEYTYDHLSRIVEEKVLDKNIQFCYTYDELSRVTKRTTKHLNGAVLSEETFAYDAAGNIVGANGDTDFAYDTNNRLTNYNGQAVAYDADGNMVSCGDETYTFDCKNRLTKAGENEYTYNAENVRIRNLCGEYDTTYVYDNAVKLSRMLMKTTNGIVTKYVYGLGLIGEEKEWNFKTYHFDYRGSTVAITDIWGNVTDTFEYDTYGKMVSHVGDSFVIFGYNGRDGVVTDKNGLIYMRARYYSPDMKRFINADIIAGKISNAVTLNRFAYANGNPVSLIDPFGLSAERGGSHVCVKFRSKARRTVVKEGASLGKSRQKQQTIYDEILIDFQKLESAQETYEASKIDSQSYYRVSAYSIGGSAGNETASASGSVSIATAYAGVIDDGIGVEAGVAGASAEGNLNLGNLDLKGEVNVLSAEANAELLYEDGLKAGVEAKVSVASAEGSFTIDLFFFEIVIGGNADFLSAGVEASIGAGPNDDGEFEISFEAEAGVGLFGLGFDIALVF